MSGVALNAAERRKVDRYLDATRASLLFARQLMLVEGVAEAVLIRTLAEQIVFPASRDGDAAHPQNRQKREQFRAVSILPIGGVDFLPYLRLLLHDGRAIADRVVVITDGDQGQGDARRTVIEEEFADHVANQILHVKVGTTTLEAELYALLHNEPVLRSAFAQQHPRSLAKWDAISSDTDGSEERAKAFAAALRNKELDLGKGDFGHVVADLLETSEQVFEVPTYLRQAITAVVLPVA
jgi:putative ATP-dependent endonuclease of OLD family